MGLSVAMITPWGKNVRCGIRTYSEKLVNALAKLGVDIYIVRWPRFGARTPELVESMVLDKIPVDQIALVHVQHEYGLFSPNLEASFFKALKSFGKPIVTTMHAVGNWEVDRIIAEASDRVMVHNEFCFKRFGYPEKTVIIEHGCEPKECPPADECKRSLGIDPRIPIVGYQGFISSYKGLETLIEAMTKVPNAALLIGGGWHVEAETDYIMRLKRWSLETLKGRCQWLGYVEDERLPTVYGAMSIVVYPSRYISESGALLMALSHGKAVIASNLPPTREKAMLGALMTFKSVEDLRRKIRRLLKDEALRRGLEEDAKAYAESVSWPKVAEKHLRLYEEILNRRVTI